MKGLMLIILFVVITTNSLAAKSMCTKCDEASIKIGENSKEISKLIGVNDQQSLQSALDKVQSSLSLITAMSTLSTKNSPGALIQDKVEGQSADIVIKYYAPIVAADMLSVADSFVKIKSKGNMEIAQKLYRDVIITFTGEKYKSYVKKAEFALEDMKSAANDTPSKPKNKK